jgi:hypothetical protein
MARLLAVSTRGYYAWPVREPLKQACSDAQLLARIRALHANSRVRACIWGASGLHA